jgi:hypothetical protein
MRSLVYILILILPGFLLVSCDKEQDGVVDPAATAVPFIESAVLKSGSVDLDTSSSPYLTRNPDGSFSLKDTLSAIMLYDFPEAFTGNRELNIRWWIRTEDGRKELGSWSASLAITSTPPGRQRYSVTFNAPIDIRLNRSDAGRALTAITASIADGPSGNTVMTPLLVTRRNSLPVIWDLSLPDTIFRPTSGFALIPFTAAVRDSDGYADIREVTFRRTLPAPTAPIQMFDDGSTGSGDVAPGDGIFTRTVRIDSSARLGEQIFEFLARDLRGEVSVAAVDTVIIEPR